MQFAFNGGAGSASRAPRFKPKGPENSVPSKLYTIAYIFVIALVIGLLLSIIFFPFWKVWKRVKDHHPDLWASKGPFDVVNMLTGTGVVRSFLDIVALADKDDNLLKGDPELIKWTRMSREVWRMAPKGFGMQIVYVCIFAYFAIFLSGAILSLFPH
jgi:hypothetical protein